MIAADCEMGRQQCGFVSPAVITTK